MKDQTKGDVQIYSYFSECLKLFQKKMLLLSKIINSENQQSKKHHQNSLKQLVDQSITLIQKFEQNQSTSKSFQPIFSRFILRIRQSIHNSSLKTTSPDILTYLTFIERIIKQFNCESKPATLLKIILVKIPKNFGKNSSSQNISQIKNESLKNFRYGDIQPKKQVTSKGKDNYFDSYDRYLQALDRQYRLFDCLNIQETHYRKTFFLALEDFQKKDNNLLEDMLERNKFAKQSLEFYYKSYDNNKRKLIEKKQKFLKTQTQFNLNQIKNKQLSSNIFSQLKQKIMTKSPANIMNFSKRLKTEYNSNHEKQSLRQGSIHLNTLNGFKSNFQSQQFCISNSKKISRNYQKNTYELQGNTKFIDNDYFIKTKIFEAQKQKLGKNIHIVPLKKVQFLGAKIQLVPEQFSKRNLIINQQQRKKKIYNKTQQHVRKKISFITQTKIQRINENKADMSPSPNKKISNFNSIRIINHFKTDND